MHSSLVATRDGLPLGLAAIKFWNRDSFHGANALKRRINPTHVPIEKKESIRWLENLRKSRELLNNPERCVHIGDRESDIYGMASECRSLCHCSSKVRMCGRILTRSLRSRTLEQCKVG